MADIYKINKKLEDKGLTWQKNSIGLGFKAWKIFD